MQQIGPNSYQKEFEWELNSWNLGIYENPLGYNLWIVDGVLYLSNDMDLVESIEITNKEQLDEIITRLTQASKDVFG